MDFSGLETHQKPAIFPTEFRTEYEDDAANPGQMKGVDWVTWVKKGTSNGATTSEKVGRLKKDAVLWPVLEPYYEAWKKKQDAPVDGTPLDAWPGLTVQQAKVLRDFNLRSIEDFADASDSTLAKINLPGIRALQMRARAFREAAQSKSVIAAEIAKRDEEIATLKANLADAIEAIKAIQADDAEAPVKRGPGRTRKDA